MKQMNVAYVVTLSLIGYYYKLRNTIQLFKKFL